MQAFRRCRELLRAWLYRRGSVKEAALPPGLPLSKWKDVGAFLQKVDGGIHWAIGDWLLYGHEAYEHGQYEGEAEALGFEKGAIANDKSIAQAIESSRRRED